MAFRKLDPLNPLRDTDVRAREAMRFPRSTGAPWVPPPAGGPEGPQLPPVTQASANAQYVRQVYPPWIEKIGGISRDFNIVNYGLLLPAGPGSIITLTPTFRAPAGQVGWIQEFELYILGPTATSRVTYTLRVNQGPVAGFDNQQIPPGAANLILIPKNDIRVRLPDGAVVDVLITNGSAAAETVGARVSGWYHPLDAELRAWGPV